MQQRTINIFKKKNQESVTSEIIICSRNWDEFLPLSNTTFIFIFVM